MPYSKDLTVKEEIKLRIITAIDRHMVRKELRAEKICRIMQKTKVTSAAYRFFMGKKTDIFDFFADRGIELRPLWRLRKKLISNFVVR